MPAITHHLRSLFVRRTVSSAPTAIIWWGSGPRGATVGDALAVRNLSAELSRRDHVHSIVSHPDFATTGHVVTDDLARLRPGIDTVVFACGPLVGTGRLTFLLDRFPKARRYAVGVSVLPGQEAFTRRFSGFVARDGMVPAYFDLAVAAVEPPAPPPAGRPVRVGLCFRGHQREHGVAACRTERAEALLRGLVGRFALEPETFTTVLGRDRTVEAVLERLRSVDIVFTTRLHGGLLALAAGKPVIVVDQITGGAKVLPVMERTGWPHVWAVDAVHDAAPEQALRSFLQAWPVAEVVAAQRRALAASREAVRRAADLVVTGQAASPTESASNAIIGARGQR